KLYSSTSIVAAVDLAVQLTLAILGTMLVLDLHTLTAPIDLGTAPTWNAVAFSIPIAMVAFAGLEVVATLLREARDPGRALARGTISGVVATIVIYTLIAATALSAFPVHPAPATPSGAASDISLQWLGAPLAGVAEAVGDAVSPSVGTA